MIEKSPTLIVSCVFPVKIKSHSCSSSNGYKGVSPHRVLESAVIK